MRYPSGKGDLWPIVTNGMGLDWTLRFSFLVTAVTAGICGPVCPLLGGTIGSGENCTPIPLGRREDTGQRRRKEPALSEAERTSCLPAPPPARKEVSTTHARSGAFPDTFDLTPETCHLTPAFRGTSGFENRQTRGKRASPSGQKISSQHGSGVCAKCSVLFQDQSQPEQEYTSASFT